MKKYKWYHFEWGKLTSQRVRQIITIGLPEIILPEHVAKFGFIPYVIPEKPKITNLQKVVEDGIEVTETEATQKWKVVNKFATPEEEQEYLDNIAAQELAAQIEATNNDNLKADIVLNALKTRTYAEVETWINDNTTWTIKEKALISGLAKVAMHIIKGRL